MRATFKLLRQATVSFSLPRGLVLIDDFHSPVAAHCVVSCDACWLCLDRWLRRNFSRNAEALAYGGLCRFRSRCHWNYQSTRARSAKPGSQLPMPSSGKTRESRTTCGDSPRLAAGTASGQLPCHSALTSSAQSYAGGSRTLRRLALAIVDAFLLSNPAGRAKSGVHVTDATTASRTALLQP